MYGGELVADRQHPLVIRNADLDLWRQVKQEARRHDMTAAALLNQIVGEWMAAHQCASIIAPLVPAETDN